MRASFHSLHCLEVDEDHYMVMDVGAFPNLDTICSHNLDLDCCANFQKIKAPPPRWHGNDGKTKYYISTIYERRKKIK